MVNGKMKGKKAPTSRVDFSRDPMYSAWRRQGPLALGYVSCYPRGKSVLRLRLVVDVVGQEEQEMNGREGNKFYVFLRRNLE